MRSLEALGMDSLRRIYLILHHCLTNILNHTAKFIHVLNIVEKAFGPPLFCEEGQFSANSFQLPGNLHVSDPALGTGDHCLTVPVSTSFLAP